MDTDNRPLWFAGGEKGGVGKSTCAHLLIDYLRERLGGRLLVIETDPVNPDVGRTFYDKNFDDVVLHPFAIHTVNDWMNLMNLVEDSPDNALLINGAAQLYKSLEVGQHIIQSVGELRRQWVTWWVMGPELDSVAILDRYVSMVDAGILSRSQRLIVIENAGRANEQHFRAWRESKLYVRLVEAGCPIVEVSHLATDVADEMRKREWSIAEARAELRVVYRAELERWCNAAFSSISQALGDG